MQNCTPTFRLIFLLTLIIIFPTTFLSAQKIITVAGNSNGNGPGYSKKYNPTPTSYGVAPDEYGNVFYSEIDKSTITKIDVDGNVVLIAGMYAEPGFSGDGGLATNAKLAGPKGIYVAKNGNIYIADTYNQRVRKIDQNGIITTIAGGGTGGDGTLAINASLSGPVDVITDSVGNVYISEQGANKIRKVNTRGIISTVAGNGTAGFNGDSVKAVKASLNQQTGICFDENGNLIIADTHNHRIRKVNKNGIITTVAGNGLNTTSCISVKDDTTSALATIIGTPDDVRVDDNNNIFFKTNECSLLYVDTKGKIHLAEADYNLGGIDYKNGFIYFARNSEDICYFEFPSVYKYDIKTHKTYPVYYNYFSAPVLTAPNKNMPAGMSLLSSPKGLYFYNNNILISDYYNIKKIDNKGLIQVIAGDGIAGYNGYGDGGNALNARFGEPTGLVRDTKGNIFIADHSDGRIRKIDKNNIITTFATTANPYDLEIDDKGNLYMSSDFSSNIYKFNSSGQSQVYAKGFSSPEGIAFDKHGNLFVADYGSNTVRKIDSSGKVTLFAGTNGKGGFSGDGGPAIEATLGSPSGVGVDDNGNVFISDEQNNRIRKVDTAGIITTIAGGGLGESYRCDGDHLDYGSFSGDDDIAIKANLDYPEDITVNAKGNVIFVDSYNRNLREIELNCIKKPLSFSYGITTYVNRSMEINYDCNLLCKFYPTGNYLNALNDFTTSNVWVEKTVITDSSKKPFVARHFQVYPVKDSNYSSTSILTLYFTQAEFNSYNSKANGYLKLPASPTDQEGIHNLRVYAYKSKSKDSSGLPRSYSTVAIPVNPADGNIVWNTDNNYWEVSFNISSFGGFFVGTENNVIAAAKEEKIQKNPDLVSVYPNPATDMINVVLPVSLLYKPVQLYNADGKLMNTKNADAQNISFDLKDISAGIYIIRFADGTFKKVIVTKY